MVSSLHRTGIVTIGRCSKSAGYATPSSLKTSIGDLYYNNVFEVASDDAVSRIYTHPYFWGG